MTLRQLSHLTTFIISRNSSVSKMAVCSMNDWGSIHGLARESSVRHHVPCPAARNCGSSPGSRVAKAYGDPIQCRHLDYVRLCVHSPYAPSWRSAQAMDRLTRLRYDCYQHLITLSDSTSGPRPHRSDKNRTYRQKVIVVPEGDQTAQSHGTLSHKCTAMKRKLALRVRKKYFSAIFRRYINYSCI